MDGPFFRWNRSRAHQGDADHVGNETAAPALPVRRFGPARTHHEMAPRRLREAADGGGIGLIRDNDIIRIDSPSRTINLLLEEGEMEKRRELEDQKDNGWKPDRERKVSVALKAYASMVSSADRGAIRQLKD